MTVSSDADVAVIGASLGGLAAAVRLAKLGHAVTVIDATARPAPVVPDTIELPAAWRDLFRKSGRILDAVLAEAGLDLVPAPPLTLVDGVDLPTDRGEQFETVSKVYGLRQAYVWRDLLDELDQTWQLVRRLGLEAEVDADDPSVARLLADRTSVADVAARISAPPLAHVVLQVALARGVDPTVAPSWWATQLVVRRTFGVWQVVDASGIPQPGAVLADLLAARAVRRKVTSLTATVTAIEPDQQGVRVTLADGATLVARAGISAVDLWRHRALTGGPPPAIPRRLGPLVRRATPLAATASGRPTWSQRGTWRALEPISSANPVRYAGSGTIAGDLPWARLLAGALATYQVHEALTGHDVRPSNTSGHRVRAARR